MQKCEERPKRAIVRPKNEIARSLGGDLSIFFSVFFRFYEYVALLVLCVQNLHCKSNSEKCSVLLRRLHIHFLRVPGNIPRMSKV